jgi:hypothetical protein
MESLGKALKELPVAICINGSREADYMMGPESFESL